MGLPTMSLRPITTARRPATGISCRASSSMMPAGVQGTKRARFCTSRPTFSGWNPSTSFAGSTRSRTRVASTCGGSGSCTRMPWMSRLRLYSSTTAATSSVVAVAAIRRVSLSRPRCSHARVLLPT